MLSLGKLDTAVPAAGIADAKNAHIVTNRGNENVEE